MEHPPPGAEVIETLGIRVVAPLGGRLNQHWLVDARGERLVLRRRAKTTADDIDYELRLLASLAELGWPVAPAVGEPAELDGQMWCLFPFLPGDPPSTEDPLAEQRARGRLLARLHADLAGLDGFGQRGAWRRCEQILSDPAIDHLLARYERERAEDVRRLRWHLDRARERIAGLCPQDRPGQLIHGDFAPWNLRFQNGQLSGILDFELAHWNHRIADFALSWRGKYDEVIHGYNEMSPLEPEEWELITPVWWAWLIELACRYPAEEIRDASWVTKQLLRRSPLMGRGAPEFR